MKVVIDQFNVIKDGDMRAFASWVNEISAADGGLQFFLSPKADKKDDFEIQIVALGPPTRT